MLLVVLSTWKDVDLLELVQRRLWRCSEGAAPLLWRQAEKAGVVQAGEEKALGRPWGTFQCQTGAYGDRLFSRPVKSRCKERILYSEDGETLEQISGTVFFSFPLAPW